MSAAGRKKGIFGRDWAKTGQYAASPEARLDAHFFGKPAEIFVAVM